jgi:hypothetical protein
LGDRSTVFGTLSLCTCLSDGFSGKFCASPVRLAPRATAIAVGFAVFGRVFLTLPLYFGFAFYFGFRWLKFWVSYVGFGFVGVFSVRVVRDFWWVLGGLLGWGTFGAGLGV